jgi:hypothetical protein
MRTEVYPIDVLLQKAKHLVLVYDRIPPAFLVGAHGQFVRAVEVYRRVMGWKEDGVKLVKLKFGPDPVIGFNQPYGDFYIWMSRLILQNREMKPTA